MKNYKVIATRYFKDSNETDERTGLKIERKVNDEFYCTKERYEYLKANNAVKLVEVQKNIETAINEITEEEVQVVASAIVEEAKEQDKTIEEVVNEIVEESKEEVKQKPKKKKSSKK